MRKLDEYIFESTPVGELLTFDEFADFFYDEDETPIQDKVEQMFPNKSKIELKVLKKYLTNWADEVAKYLPDGYEINDEILRIVYNQLKETPIEKLQKLIGSGEEACVFDLGDKILKAYYNHIIPADRKHFFEICKEGEFDIFPVVYRIGKDFVVMEKLQMNTPKCEKYFKLINENKYGDTMYHLVQDFKENEIQWTAEEQEVVDWLIQVRNAVAVAFGNDPETNTDFGDLQVDNVGEREDGTVVYFDI